MTVQRGELELGRRNRQVLAACDAAIPFAERLLSRFRHAGRRSGVNELPLATKRAVASTIFAGCSAGHHFCESASSAATPWRSRTGFAQPAPSFRDCDSTTASAHRMRRLANDTGGCSDRLAKHSHMPCGGQSKKPIAIARHEQAHRSKLSDRRVRDSVLSVSGFRKEIWRGVIAPRQIGLSGHWKAQRCRAYSAAFRGCFLVTPRSILSLPAVFWPMIAAAAPVSWVIYRPPPTRSPQ
jgi:hypothetical protein